MLSTFSRFAAIKLALVGAGIHPAGHRAAFIVVARVILPDVQSDAVTLHTSCVIRGVEDISSARPHFHPSALDVRHRNWTPPHRRLPLRSLRRRRTVPELRQSYP